MVAELQEHVLRCVKDANGNHVSYDFCSQMFSEQFSAAIGHSKDH